MVSPPGRFRVVVGRPRSGASPDGVSLASRLAEIFPLSEDARIALESGRSAVLTRAASEGQARRVATQVMQLGLEVRIEPEEGAGGLPPGGAAPAAGGMAGFAEEALRGESLPGREDATEPVLEGSAPPWERAADPAVSSVSSATEALDPGGVAPLHGDPRGGSEPPAERLVRCPAHGLLYDASRTNGCSRCLGGSGSWRPPFLARLRGRPRLWLALGVFLALASGAVPAALYARQVKSGSLLERRVEAQGVLLAQGRGEGPGGAYQEARARVIHTRNRAMGISALLWLATSIVVLLLYRRFV